MFDGVEQALSLLTTLHNENSLFNLLPTLFICGVCVQHAFVCTHSVYVLFAPKQHVVYRTPAAKSMCTYIMGRFDQISNNFHMCGVVTSKTFFYILFFDSYSTYSTYTHNNITHYLNKNKNKIELYIFRIWFFYFSS